MELTKSQYNTIMRSYDDKRREARYLLDKRIEQIYNECPDIMAIDNRIAKQSVERARRAISGDFHAIDSLEKDNKLLINEKEQLLVKLGYPADYLHPIYSCPLCKDSGYVDGVACSCFNKAVAKLMYDESGIKDILARQNFSFFDYNLFPDSDADIDPTFGCTPRAHMKQNMTYVRSFIENFDNTYANFLIYGNTGVGKTFLSSCIAKELLDRGHSVLYYTAYRFFELLSRAQFSSSHSEESDQPVVLEHFTECDLLIIDDLGTELTNTFTISALFSVINDRMLNHKPTVISTNLSLRDLTEKYTERIMSRITQDYTFLKIIGKDIRNK